jgi:hypothetical protein
VILENGTRSPPGEQHKGGPDSAGPLLLAQGWIGISLEEEYQAQGLRESNHCKAAAH